MSSTGRPTSIVITGSRQGIGRALSQHYADRGLKVFGISRQPSDLDHPNYRHFQGDVCHTPRIREILREIDMLAPEGLEAVINNAGLYVRRLAVLTENEEALSVLNTNVVGSLAMMREAAKIMMRHRYGRVVSISSIATAMHAPGIAAYAASKAALEQLSSAFSWEFASSGITFNVVAVSHYPGTGMTTGIGERIRTQLNSQLSKPAMLNVEEVAHAIEFFLSPKAANISNQVLYFGGVR